MQPMRNMTLGMNVRALSGMPYNVTTGRDDNGDGVIDDATDGDGDARTDADADGLAASAPHHALGGLTGLATHRVIRGYSERPVDPALVRRFSRTILVDLPDKAARRQYLRIRLAEAKNATITEPALDLLAENPVAVLIAPIPLLLWVLVGFAGSVAPTVFELSACALRWGLGRDPRTDRRRRQLDKGDCHRRGACGRHGAVLGPQRRRSTR